MLQQIATEKVILGSNKKMIRLNVEEMQKNSILDSNFIESLNGIYTIKALCSEKKREYKIFCVNEKIHTKKEVPSVE